MQLKQIFLNLIIFSFSSLTFAQSVSVNHETNAGCDGFAELLDPQFYTSWTWYDTIGNQFDANVDSVTTLCPGDYSIIVDSMGFLDTVLFTINPFDPCTNFSIGYNTIADATVGNCDAQVNVVIGNPAGVSFSWSNGATTDTVVNLCAGNQFVIANNGTCIDTSFFTVIENDPCANFSSSTNSYYGTPIGTCNGTADVNVFNGSGTISYAWNNGSTLMSPTDLCGGWNYVTISSTAGCSLSDSVFVQEVNPCDSLSGYIITSNQTANGTCDGSMQVYSNGWDSNPLFSWSNGATIDSLSSLCAGTYSCTVTDSYGCSITILDSIYSAAIDSCLNYQVNVSTIEASNGICDGSALATVSSTYYGGETTYSWSNSTNDSIIENQCPGNYYVIGVNTIGCEDSVAFTITETPINPCDTFIVSINLIQNDDLQNCMGAAEAVITGGAPTVYFGWSNQDSTLIADSLCVGYHYFNAYQNGCTETDSIYISGDPCASFDLVLSSTNVSVAGACDGIVIPEVFNGATIASYSWSDGSTTDSLINVCAGTYTLTVTDINGCIDSATAYVSVDSVFSSFMIGNVTTVNMTSASSCDGTATVNISTGVAPFTYSHSNGSTNQTATNLCEGLHNVLIIDAVQDSLYLDYLIVSPTNLYTSLTFVDSTLIDSLVSPVIENCIIDYATVDSAYVSNTIVLGADSLQIDWIIIDTNGSHTVSQIVMVNPQTGYYLVELSLYCSNKATGDLLKAQDRFYLNSGSASIENFDLINMTLFPNPTTGKLNIKSDQNIKKIFIYSQVGKLVQSNLNTFDPVELIDLTNQPNGIYILKIQTENGVVTRKVSKSN